MKCFGVSSYFLWTQKGATVLPLVRGSGFLLKFERLSTFYRYHVISAAHVACPIKYPAIYGDTAGLKALGERHITTGLLLPGDDNSDSSSGLVRQVTTLPCAFVQKRFLNLDVVSLRIKDEMRVLENPNLAADLDAYCIDVDAAPITKGEELVFCGARSVEDQANASDSDLRLRLESFEGRCHSVLQSLDYGTVVLASSTDGARPHASMCGGPVLRKSSGKCVGVLVAPVLCCAPPTVLQRHHATGGAGSVPPDVQSLIREPWLDISAVPELQEDQRTIAAAFVPIREFLQPLRHTEA